MSRNEVTKVFTSVTKNLSKDSVTRLNGQSFVNDTIYINVPPNNLVELLTSDNELDNDHKLDVDFSDSWDITENKNDVERDNELVSRQQNTSKDNFLLCKDETARYIIGEEMIKDFKNTGLI